MTQQSKLLFAILGGSAGVVLLSLLAFRAGADSAGQDGREDSAQSAAVSDTSTRSGGTSGATREGIEGRETRRSWLSRALGSHSTVTLPAGSEVPVDLVVALDSSDVRNGDALAVTLARDLMVDGRVVARAGSRGSARIVEIDRAGRVEGRERLTLALSSLEIDGRERTVRTAPVTLVGHGGKKEDAAVIGGAAAAGAIIGAITGGGDGAAKGAAIGGAGGTGVVLSTRGPDIDLPAGHQLTFRLSEDLALVPLS